MWGPRTFIARRLDAFSRRYGYDMGYAHQILGTGLRAFRAFQGLFTLAAYRDPVLPKAPWFTAKWVATHNEGCGPCQQLGIHMALEEGMDAREIKAVVEGRVQDMSPDVALTYQWARAIIQAQPSPQADALRSRVVARWGEAGLTSLALAMAGARSFPMLKRALGHNTSCAILSIEHKAPASR